MAAMLQNAFDPSSVPPATGASGNLPVSDAKGHVVVIRDSELKPTQDSSGTMLVLSLEIVEGPHSGATGVYRLNIFNTNATAQQIAYQRLSAVCHVIGHLQPLSDVSVLHNRPFRVVVKLQSTEEGRNKGYTEVDHVLTVNGGKPGVARSQQSPSMSSGFGAMPAGFPTAAAPQQQTQQPQFPVQNVPMQQPAFPTQQQVQQPQQGFTQQANPQTAPWAR